MGTQQEIDKLKGVANGVVSVVGSAIALIAGLGQRFRDAADDPEEIRAIADELDARRVELAQAVALNTPASDEVPADDGGTGDDDENVDPEGDDITSAVEDAVIPATPTEPAPTEAGTGEASGEDQG